MQAKRWQEKKKQSREKTVTKRGSQQKTPHRHRKKAFPRGGTPHPYKIKNKCH